MNKTYHFQETLFRSYFKWMGDNLKNTEFSTCYFLRLQLNFAKILSDFFTCNNYYSLRLFKLRFNHLLGSFKHDVLHKKKSNNCVKNMQLMAFLIKIGKNSLCIFNKEGQLRQALV